MTFSNTAPVRATLLALAMTLGLAACANDPTSPTSGESRTQSKNDTSLDLGTRGATTRGQGPNLDLRLVDRSGSTPTWAVLNKAGRPVATMSDLPSAVDAVFADPARGYQVAFGFDFGDRAAYQQMLAELGDYHARIWGDPHVDEILHLAQTDPGQLTRFERRYYRNVLRPMGEAIDTLDQLRAAEANPQKIWGVLKAFIEVLVSGEDNRFGDHDEDGTINAKDDDYEGTLWSGGAVTVSSDGEGGTDVSVGGCFDPCPIPAACD